MTSNRDWLHSAPLEEIYAWMDAEHEPSGDGAQSFAGKCDALRDDLMALQTEAIAKLQEQVGKLTAERDGWRMRCGELLDAAHAMQGVADAWDEEVR